jgi:hypothetical protein
LLGGLEGITVDVAETSHDPVLAMVRCHAERRDLAIEDVGLSPARIDLGTPAGT